MCKHGLSGAFGVGGQTPVLPPDAVGEVVPQSGMVSGDVGKPALQMYDVVAAMRPDVPREWFVDACVLDRDAPPAVVPPPVQALLKKYPAVVWEDGKPTPPPVHSVSIPMLPGATPV